MIFIRSTLLDLLRATEQLTEEKLKLIEDHEEERKRFLKDVRLLERAVDENAENNIKNEEEYLDEIDDLKKQVLVLCPLNCGPL